jgi:hypothetical protein
MIILSQTTDKLQVVLAGAHTANALQCFASWRDRTSTTFIAGRTAADTNGASDVDLVGSPGASTQRVIDFISVFNSDTANATVTLKLDANGTECILFKAVIGVGEMINYNEGKGFFVIANSGAVKQSINQGNNTTSSSLSSVILGADVSNADVTPNTIANVTGLSFAVTAGHIYYFRFIIWYTSAATTTGSRWSINGPANSLLGFVSSIGLSAAGTAGTDTTTITNVAAYDSPTTVNATSPTATAGQANIAIMEGLINVSADGSVIARFASEITVSAITAKAGSVVYYQQLT